MFSTIFFTQLLWTLGTNFPPKTEICVARLDETAQTSEHCSNNYFDLFFSCLSHCLTYIGLSVVCQTSYFGLHTCIVKKCFENNFGS